MEGGDDEFEKLPIEWLRINPVSHPQRGFDYAYGFIANIDKELALVFETCYTQTVTTLEPVKKKLCRSFLESLSNSVKTEKERLPIFSNALTVGSLTGTGINHCSLQQRQSGLVHSVSYLKSISDNTSMLGKMPQSSQKKNKDDNICSETKRNEVVGKVCFGYVMI